MEDWRCRAELDQRVFAGGIEENIPPVRTLICEELGFFGIELKETQNAANADVISPAAVGLRV